MRCGARSRLAMWGQTGMPALLRGLATATLRVVCLERCAEVIEDLCCVFLLLLAACLRLFGAQSLATQGAKGRDLPVLWCRPHTDCRPVFQGFMIS